MGETFYKEKQVCPSSGCYFNSPPIYTYSHQDTGDSQGKLPYECTYSHPVQGLLPQQAYSKLLIGHSRVDCSCQHHRSEFIHEDGGDGEGSRYYNSP